MLKCLHNATFAIGILSCCHMVCHPLRAADKDKSPNILFVLADDLAWTDLGCYGHAWHETPFLDSLAQEGLRFSDGYAPAPICSAARASILTGKTCARLNFEFVTKERPGVQQIEGDVQLQTPPFTLNLPLEEKTLPECLNELGYESAFFGKWHLNAHYQHYLGWSPMFGPSPQGFQVAVEDFGSHPYAWGKSPPPDISHPGEYPEDTMIRRAAKFIAQPHSQPYFLQVSMFHVHTPVRTNCSWLLEKYADKVPIDIPNRKKRIAYAAFVETLDRLVGELLDALDRSGARDQTLVVFTSDNGGHPEYAANGPLRGSKWNLYEGGIRVPLIARWPSQIAPNSVTSTPAIGYDLLPTMVDVAGGQPPDVDGLSLRRLFLEPTWRPDRELLWHFPYYHPEKGYADALEEIGVDDFAVSKTRPQSAIRRGDYKLLRFYEDQRVELYHLASDLSEQQDRKAEDGSIAIELQRRLASALRNANARLPTR